MVSLGENSSAISYYRSELIPTRLKRQALFSRSNILAKQPLYDSFTDHIVFSPNQMQGPAGATDCNRRRRLGAAAGAASPCFPGVWGKSSLLILSSIPSQRTSDQQDNRRMFPDLTVPYLPTSMFLCTLSTCFYVSFDRYKLNYTTTASIEARATLLFKAKAIRAS